MNSYSVKQDHLAGEKKNQYQSQFMKAKNYFQLSWKMLARSPIHQDRVLSWYLTVNSAGASPLGCHTFREKDLWVAHISPHHVTGKAKPGGGTDMPSLQPQNMIQPDGTSDNSPLQPGHAGFPQGTHQPSLSPLWEEIWAQREPQHPWHPPPEAQRPGEGSKRINNCPLFSAIPALLKRMRRVYNKSKTGSELRCVT